MYRPTHTPFGTLENPVDGDENPFRFSSEYHDDETGLVYYNYRYYSPELGRWIKRDPIEEEGGMNLYSITQNNTLNAIDYLGTMSLGAKIMVRWGGRVLKGLTLPGIIHNHLSYSSPISFDDEENELADFAFMPTLLEIRADAIKRNLNSKKFIDFSIGKFNAAPKYGTQGIFVMSGPFPSTGWWLGSTAVYNIAIDYQAACGPNVIYYKNVKIKYEWRDNIDANSYLEAMNKGAFDKYFSASTYINTIEGTWDLIMEKIAGSDYKIIITGDTSISDGSFVPLSQ